MESVWWLRSFLLIGGGRLCRGLILDAPGEIIVELLGASGLARCRQAGDNDKL
jgi:hypothetical protein